MANFNGGIIGKYNVPVDNGQAEVITTFNSSGTLTTGALTTAVEYLVIAGGGGAGAVGTNTAPSQSGPGGVGKQIALFDGFGTDASNVASSGDYFAGGGGGNTQSATPYWGIGGIGGGARGGNYNAAPAEDTAGRNGIANTGGGAGASASNSTYGTYQATGGSGTLIIRRLTLGAAGNMILVSNSITAVTAPTKGDIVFTYSNGAGTAVLGTNITADYSADAGSTWTAFTLASQGVSGGHTIVTGHDEALTSTSGTAMRYRVKTLVQSASMDTRIHAVSLGWS